jgi:hypothetical protein
MAGVEYREHVCPGDVEARHGGIGRGKPVDQVVLTLDASDLDAAMAKAVAAGAKVVQPRGPIPGVGWYAAVRVPDGNLFGLMQDDPAARQASKRGRVGVAPVCGLQSQSAKRMPRVIR